MALPKTIDDPQALPELVRDHYTQKEGVWTLTLLAPEEYQVTVTALDTERKKRRDVEVQLTEVKTKFEGIDPAEVTRMQQQLKDVEDKKVYDDHGLEELRNRWTHEMKTAHGRELAAKDRELSVAKGALQDLDHKWRSDRIETALMTAAGRAGVAKEALDDAVARGRRVFVDVNEQGMPVAKNGDEVRYGKDGVTPFTPDEFYLSLKTDAAHLWPPSSGGGARPNHAGATNGVDYTAITSPTERLTAYRQAQRSGARGT